MLLERIRIISMLCLSAFGCIGNVLTLIIVNRRFFRKTASAAFISGLSIADGLVLCLQTLQILTKSNPQVTSYDCVVFYFMHVFILLSTWIVCVINIERCSLVFNPCNLSRITSPIKAHFFVFILFIISMIIFSHYGSHMSIEYHYEDLNQTIMNRSYCAYKPGFWHSVWETIRSVLTYWFAIPLCIICNTIIIRRLYQAGHIERSLVAQTRNKLYLSTKQRQLTIMLVASSLCFILTVTPSIVHTIYVQINGNVTPSQYMIHIFTDILLHFHHAINFLAFTFSCVRFRRELLEMFRIYLRCEIYTTWHKRSAPGTEQVGLNSNKQQKIPMKLLGAKSNSRRRSNPQVLPIIVIGRTKNPCKLRTGRTQRHGKMTHAI